MRGATLSRSIGNSNYSYRFNRVGTIAVTRGTVYMVITE
jgi:hypothetical protein